MSSERVSESERVLFRSRCSLEPLPCAPFSHDLPCELERRMLRILCNFIFEPDGPQLESSE